MNIIRTPPPKCSTFTLFILCCIFCYIVKTMLSLLSNSSLFLLVLVWAATVLCGETETQLLTLNTSPKSNNEPINLLGSLIGVRVRNYKHMDNPKTSPKIHPSISDNS